MHYIILLSPSVEYLTNFYFKRVHNSYRKFWEVYWDVKINCYTNLLLFHNKLLVIKLVYSGIEWQRKSWEVEWNRDLLQHKTGVDPHTWLLQTQKSYRTHKFPIQSFIFMITFSTILKAYNFPILRNLVKVSLRVLQKNKRFITFNLIFLKACFRKRWIVSKKGKSFLSRQGFYSPEYTKKRYSIFDFHRNIKLIRS